MRWIKAAYGVATLIFLVALFAFPFMSRRIEERMALPLAAYGLFICWMGYKRACMAAIEAKRIRGGN